MLEKLILSGALMFTPLVDDIQTQDPPITEETPSENTDWENAKDTVIEWTEDINGDGIPDKIHDLYDQWKSTELVGGFTIGALVSIIIAFLGIGSLFMTFRKKIKNALETSDKAVDSANKQTEEYIKQSNEMLEKLSEENTELKSQIDSIIATVQMHSEVSKQIAEDIEENSKSLDRIETSNKKVSLLLDNQVKMACNSDELVSKGIAKDLKTAVETLESDSNERKVN